MDWRQEIKSIIARTDITFDENRMLVFAYTGSDYFDADKKGVKQNDLWISAESNQTVTEEWKKLQYEVIACLKPVSDCRDR